LSIAKGEPIPNLIQDDPPALFGLGLTVGLPSGNLVETSCPFIGLEDPQHRIVEAAAAQPLRGSLEKGAAVATAPMGGVQVNRIDLA